MGGPALFRLLRARVVRDAERLQVRRIEPARGCKPNRDDVVDDRRGLTAANAVGVLVEMAGAKLAPLGVISSSPRTRPGGVMAGLAIAIGRFHVAAARPGGHDTAA